MNNNNSAITVSVNPFASAVNMDDANAIEDDIEASTDDLAGITLSMTPTICYARTASFCPCCCEEDKEEWLERLDQLFDPNENPSHGYDDDGHHDVDDDVVNKDLLPTNMVSHVREEELQR
jgi:hypothetical protein